MRFLLVLPYTKGADNFLGFVHACVSPRNYAASLQRVTSIRREKERAKGRSIVGFILEVSQPKVRVKAGVDSLETTVGQGLKSCRHEGDLRTWQLLDRDIILKEAVGLSVRPSYMGMCSCQRITHTSAVHPAVHPGERNDVASCPRSWLIGVDYGLRLPHEQDNFGYGESVLSMVFALNGLAVGVLQLLGMRHLVRVLGKHVMLILGNLLLALGMIGMALSRQPVLHFMVSRHVVVVQRYVCCSVGSARRRGGEDAQNGTRHRTNGAKNRGIDPEPSSVAAHMSGILSPLIPRVGSYLVEHYFISSLSLTL